MLKTAKYLAPLVLACFIGCATMPDKRVQNVMTPEEKKQEIQAVKLSRQLWQAGSVLAGVAIGLTSNGEPGIKTAVTCALPVMFLSVTSFANLASYAENEKERKYLFDFTVAGVTMGAVIGGLLYAAVATGPAASRTSNDALIIPWMITASAFVFPSLGVIWANIENLFAGGGEI
ncbi:MAG: hypothetical protein JXR81_05705 [Candidatus Goldbacteria bacterium]|nr:hypothetical protein [Candidatus Goldiibacteriota bacterium]